LGQLRGEVIGRELLDGCLKGKRKYQEMLFRQYYAFGMSVTLRYLPAREDAQEVLNDSFLKVFQNLETYNEQKPFKTWFRRIIINSAIDFFRKKSKIAFQNEPIETEKELSIEPEFIRTMNANEILALFEKLPNHYRVVFNLFEVEGFSHEEIGGMLDVSPGTSRSSLSRAKRMLREQYFKIINKECHEAI
jgi:RNA polymerase sigma factor (sigma-70 family)